MDKPEGRFAQFQLISFISAAFGVHTVNAARDHQGQKESSGIDFSGLSSYPATLDGWASFILNESSISITLIAQNHKSQIIE